MKDYNFFEIYEKKKGISINPKSVTFIGLVLLMLLIVISLGTVGRNFYLSYHTDKLTADTERMKAGREYVEAQKIQDSVDAMKDYDKKAEIALKKFKNSNTLGTNILTKISAAIPAGIKLDSMNMDHVVTVFSFIVPDRNAADELMANLKALDIFEDVHLISVTLNEDKIQYTSNIECIMKAGDENE
jgi:Tfp pilus assembly protein PilN